MVTHDAALGQECSNLITLRDGAMVEVPDVEVPDV
jgi:predicted ABC-type transport system involved in lysophospholipase L1 biosynthesis ATPase subunit